MFEHSNAERDWNNYFLVSSFNFKINHIFHDSKVVTTKSWGGKSGDFMNRIHS
jgi:hypothetical protein